VLPTTPAPAEPARPVSAEDVIDLRSPDTEERAADNAAWEPALGSLSGLGDEELPLLLSGSPDGEVAGEAHVAAQASAALLPAATALQYESIAILVQRAREADSGAWEELVARFGGMIAATGRRYRLTPSDVAELQQTTWLRLVENLHRIEQPERVGGWLATTARRESLQLLKRAAKYHSGADQMLANMPDRHLPEPDARPIAEESGLVLRAAWERLRPRCQELLSLLIAEDPLGYKDLSQLLQMPVGSIGPTRARCLEHLRRLVEEEGVTAG
jgi:RNA polymerase sigma factor (sigma-70 family)